MSHGNKTILDIVINKPVRYNNFELKYGQNINLNFNKIQPCPSLSQI